MKSTNKKSQSNEAQRFEAIQKYSNTFPVHDNDHLALVVCKLGKRAKQGRVYSCVFAGSSIATSHSS